MDSVTQLLKRATAGDSTAVQQLFAQLYPDIRRIARARLAEVDGVTGLNTTALVHEGFIKMAATENLRGAERVQFFAYVGTALRSVVLDHFKARSREKRGGNPQIVSLQFAEDEAGASSIGPDLALLDAAIAEIRERDAELAQTIEMYFFAGMTIVEIAAERGVSTRTVDRDLKKARLLLADALDA